MKYIRYQRNVDEWRSKEKTGRDATDIWEILGSDSLVLIYDHMRGNVISDLAQDVGHYSLWATYAEENGIDEPRWARKFARGYWVPDHGILALYAYYGTPSQPSVDVFRQVAEQMEIPQDEIDLYVVMGQE
jgi:hypothetical protein